MLALDVFGCQGALRALSPVLNVRLAGAFQDELVGDYLVVRAQLRGVDASAKCGVNEIVGGHRFAVRHELLGVGLYGNSL